MIKVIYYVIRHEGKTLTFKSYDKAFNFSWNHDFAEIEKYENGTLVEII